MTDSADPEFEKLEKNFENQIAGQELLDELLDEMLGDDEKFENYIQLLHGANKDNPYIDLFVQFLRTLWNGKNSNCD